MPKIQVLNKSMRVNLYDLIRLQIYMHCFSKKINLSLNETDCLVLLSVIGETGLSDFCDTISERKIFKTPQTVRNFLSKAESLNLIEKNGTSKKTVRLHNDMHVLTNGNIMLDYKIGYVSEKK